MPDNPIELPDFIIAELYKNTLVEITELPKIQRSTDAVAMPAMQMQEPPPVNAIKFLGKNGKQVIFVVNNSDAAFLNDHDLQFLTRLLGACKLNLGDIAIVNTNTMPLTFARLKEEFGAKTFLLFGVETADIKLPFDIPLFQVQQYAGCTIVPAPAIATLNLETPDAKLKKRSLWDSLQRCFNLN